MMKKKNFVRAILNGNGPWILFQFANRPRIPTSIWEWIFDSRLVWKSILKSQFIRKSILDAQIIGESTMDSWLNKENIFRFSASMGMNIELPPYLGKDQLSMWILKRDSRTADELWHFRHLLRRLIEDDNQCGESFFHGSWTWWFDCLRELNMDYSQPWE